VKQNLESTLYVTNGRDLKNCNKYPYLVINTIVNVYGTLMLEARAGNKLLTVQKFTEELAL
jgi:hypothetical protein